MKPAIIAVDVDEVCADLLGEWMRRYNRDYKDTILPENITQWDLTQEVKPECGKRIYDYLHDFDLYDHVLPIQGARTAVYELLAQGHRVVYATSCPEGTESFKQKWLLRYGFLTQANKAKDFLPVSDKSLVRADFLFDDRLENVQGFKGKGVLVDRSYNRKAIYKYRVASLAQAPAYVNFSARCI